MFRLPVCPHCGTVYRYSDVRKALRKKENTCYHCEKGFRAKVFPHILAEVIPLAAICIAVNIALLSRMKELELLPMFAVTVGFMILGWLIMPFFAGFTATNKTEKKKQCKHR